MRSHQSVAALARSPAGIRALHHPCRAGMASGCLPLPAIDRMAFNQEKANQMKNTGDVYAGQCCVRASPCYASASVSRFDLPKIVKPFSLAIACKRHRKRPVDKRCCDQSHERTVSRQHDAFAGGIAVERTIVEIRPVASDDLAAVGGVTELAFAQIGFADGLPRLTTHFGCRGFTLHGAQARTRLRRGCCRWPCRCPPGRTCPGPSDCRSIVRWRESSRHAKVCPGNPTDSC